MTDRTLSRREALRASIALGTTALGLGAGLGCAAIYPELGTRIQPMPAGMPLDPPPPDELRWVAFESAEIPEATRDGRAWGRKGGVKGLPDAVARLYVDDVELIRTNAAPKTLSPRFTGKHGNFPIAAGAKLRVELWDSDPLNDRAIGSQSSLVTPEMLADGRWRASFDMGGSVTLRIEPAHPVFGLGLWYELRQGGSGITRLLDNSPASRAGLRKGDDILQIGPTDVAVMTADEVKSAMNAPPITGLALTVRHKDGATLVALVKSGPIYPTFSQYGPVD